MNILIFATSVGSKEEVSRVQPLLSSVEGIRKWTFDLEDCDKILRVVSKNIPARFIEELLQKAGFVCDELKY